MQLSQSYIGVTWYVNRFRTQKTSSNARNVHRPNPSVISGGRLNYGEEGKGRQHCPDAKVSFADDIKALGHFGEESLWHQRPTNNFPCCCLLSIVTTSNSGMEC